MKKSLLAVALLGTFAASAFAAPSVTLYGRIDTGLAYTHKDLDKANVDATDTFEMTSGFSTGSRWGLRGTEDIGSVKVGFQLENGFSSDDGKIGQNGGIFGRLATINVSGAYGQVIAGRMDSIVTDGGPATIGGTLGVLGDASAIGNVFGIVGTQKGSTGSSYARHDNTLAYVSPKFAGLQARAMYSFKSDSSEKAGTSDGRENSRDADRYAAAALTYKAGKAAVVLTGDYTWHDYVTHATVDDGYSIILGGNYDFGVTKVFAKGTYFDNQTSALDSFSLIKDSGAKAVKGWGAEISANTPLFGGNLITAVGYREAKDVANSDNKFKRLNAVAAYKYSLSKRTSVYAAAGYAQEKADEVDGRKANATQVATGLVHNF